jgi:hypothetical protein
MMRSAMNVPTAMIVLGVLWLVAPEALAATVYQFDSVFSPPTGAVTPLASVTLTDLGNAVQFDLVNQAGAGTKLDSLYFNFANGTLNPNQLVFSNVNTASNTYSTLLAPTTSTTLNGLKADGDGYFDGKIQYTGNNFLANGQILSFQLSAAGYNLSVEDFNFFSIPGGGAGSYILASHIQNMPYSGTAVWVGTVAAVPLPAAAILFASGLSGITWWRRRQL